MSTTQLRVEVVVDAVGDKQKDIAFTAPGAVQTEIAEVWWRKESGQYTEDNENSKECAAGAQKTKGEKDK